MNLISPERLFALLLDVERKITLADERFAVAVLGQQARDDTRKILDALCSAERVFAVQPLPLRRRRRR